MTHRLLLLPLVLAACNGLPDTETISTGFTFAQVTAADADSIYVLQANGSLARVPKAGGDPVALTPALETYASGPGVIAIPFVDGLSLALDATDAYFTTWAPAEGVRTAVVWRVPLAGGTPTALKKYPAEKAALAIDETRVYVVHTPALDKTKGGVEAIPKAGGDAVELAKDRRDPRAIATDATRVYWIDGGTGALDGKLSWILKTGGTPADLARQLRSPSALQVTDGRAFVMDSGSSTTDGSGIGMASGDALFLSASVEPVFWKLVLTGQKGPSGFVVEGKTMFFLQLDLFSLALDELGAEPVQLGHTASGRGLRGTFTNPVADAGHFYWATTGLNGTLVRLER